MPKGIELGPLPAHSRELQPAERVWPLADEPLAHRSFALFDERDVVLDECCITLAHRLDLVRSHTLYHWCPAGAFAGPDDQETPAGREVHVGQVQGGDFADVGAGEAHQADQDQRQAMGTLAVFGSLTYRA